MLLQVIENYLANRESLQSLAVSSRNRLATQIGANIPANGTGSTLLVVNLPPLTSFQAYFFEYLAGAYLVGAKGLTITDVFFGILDAGFNNIVVLGQPTLTTLSPQNQGGLLFPEPPLLQFEDIAAFASQGFGQNIVQPWQLALQVTAANSTAGAISLRLFLNGFVRVVYGLQEG